MRSFKINVQDLQDILLEGCENEGPTLQELRQFAKNFLTYKYVTYDAAQRATIECDTEDITGSRSEVYTPIDLNATPSVSATPADARRRRRMFYVSDEYKDEVLKTYSA